LPWNPEAEENAFAGNFSFQAFLDLQPTPGTAVCGDNDKDLLQMIHVTRRILWPTLAFGVALATPALAQAPSEAQREAIKSNCRSDYMAHCSSIPPGGAASLQCLQQNMGSLSSACASAVKAVAAPSETKAEPSPTQKEEPKQETKSEPPAGGSEPARTTAEPAAKAETKAATKTAAPAGKPSSAQIAAIRSNCRSDYPKVCAGVPTGGAPALQCLENNKAKLSPACEKAVAAASGGAAAPAASGGSTANANPNAGAGAGAAPPPPLVLRPMRPREMLFVLRSACGADVQSLCGNVPAGGGRIIECLATQSASLSPACRDVLGQFAAQ
jgi:Cysteine rich repeat